MREMQQLEFLEVDHERWGDLARLFDGRGGPKSCWCMVWRATAAEAKRTDGASRRSALRSRVEKGLPIGLLAYVHGEPMGWCSIAPRGTYRALGGPQDFADDPNAVWSLVCLFVRREFRGQGVTRQLLTAAIAHARQRGARVIEAYPVDPNSPSYRFMGFVGLFEAAGFEEIGLAGARRHVMRLKLA
jgi:GNAT superfamily N-acetyltransferase